MIYSGTIKIHTYWFKPKNYGYGYFPITWEGVLITIAILILLLISAYINNFFNIKTPPNTRNGFRFVLDLTLIILSFNPIMEKKTKEKVTWKWGK